MAKIVKPKTKGYPKRPKQSASLEVWKRYEERCKVVDKENNTRIVDYKKKVAAAESAKKAKANIIKKVQSLSGVKFK